MEAIKMQDRRRCELEAKLEAMDSSAVVFDTQMEEQLRQAVNEWRELLGRQIAQARQIVTKLLAEKLTFTPDDRDGVEGFRFEATGTVEQLIAGAIPGLSQAVVSPRGCVLLYQVEIRGETRPAT